MEIKKVKIEFNYKLHVTYDNTIMSFKNNSRNAYYTMLKKYNITKNEDCSLITIPENAQGQVTQQSFLTCDQNTKNELQDLEKPPDNSFVMTIVEKTEKSIESNTYMNYCIIL